MWQLIYTSWNNLKTVFSKSCMSFKSFGVFTAVTFCPAGFHIQFFPFETEWCCGRHNPRMCVIPQMLLAVTHSSLSFNKTFAPLLPLSPPCLSWLSSPHLFSVSLQICKIFPVFLPSVNSLCLSAYPHEKKKKFQNLQIWKVSHAVWCTTPRWRSIDERCWKNGGNFVPCKYMCFI